MCRVHAKMRKDGAVLRMEGELARAEATLADLQAEHASFVDRAESAEADKAKHAESLVEVQAQQERMVVHEAELSAQCVELETAKSTAETKLAACEDKLQDAASKGAAAATKAEALAQEVLKLEKSLGTMAQRQRKEQEDARASEDAITEAKTLFLEQKTDLMAQVAEHKMLLKDCQANLEKAQSDVVQTKDQAKDHSKAMQSRVDEAVDARADVQRKLEATQTSLGAEIEQLHADFAATGNKLAAAEAELRTVGNTADAMTVEKSVIEEALQEALVEKVDFEQRLTVVTKQHEDLAEKFNTLSHKSREQARTVQGLHDDNLALHKQIGDQLSKTWEHNQVATNCRSCTANFTATKRKHHCRNCGQIFCDKCSKQKAKTQTSKKPVRVCGPCYTDLHLGMTTDGSGSGRK